MLIHCEEGSYKIKVVCLCEQDGTLAAMPVTPLSEADVMTQATSTHDLLELSVCDAVAEKTGKLEEQVEVRCFSSRTEGSQS